MSEFRQAKWLEPLVFEIGIVRKGSFASTLKNNDFEALHQTIPEHLTRTEKPHLPVLSEIEVVRHFTNLSQMNFCIDNGFYPLGSCTMKYNPKVNDAIANSDKVHWVHPNQPDGTKQGTLEIMYKLSLLLARITGTSKISLQPAAGAHGEFAGVLIIRAYHKRNGELTHRNEIIVPDSAHGTNPSSAAMGGFRVIVVPSDSNGCINLECLKQVVSSRTAGLMLTNPNTLGILEDKILQIAEIVHDAGGILYYDGANMNAILGKATPGAMGFDIVHVNLHKTFSTPHGGGGPGAGPIGVQERLNDFLPVPLVERDEKGQYHLDYDLPYSIGKVGAFFGNFEIIVRAYCYILAMGIDGLERASEMAVLNSNYLAQKLMRIKGFEIPYGVGKLKHEFVLSCSKLKSETGVTAKNVAKRLLDYGVHSPTVYFPPIVDEALMVEPTETESKEDLDRFAQIMAEISNDAYKDASIVTTAPHNAALPLINEAKASHSRTMCLSWRMFKKAISEKDKSLT